MPALSAADLQVFDRSIFLATRLRIRPGEHTTIVGPTGCGKTWLAYQILGGIATRKMPAIVLVNKPRDATAAVFVKELGYRTVTNWPPAPSIWKDNKPPGWLVWPPTAYDPDIDRPRKHVVFRRALLDSYKRGRRWIYVDDAYGVSELLQLREELIELWTELRSNDGGLMAAFQRPSHVPLWAYSQAEHLFLFNDPDKRARERFGEIGGVDPRFVQDAVGRLGRHQALYIRRNGPRMCVVDS